MYKYIIKATPARLKSNFNFINFKEELYKACAFVSNDLVFKRDNKNVQIKDIKEFECIFILTSKFELENPCRTMSAITRYMRKYNEVEEYIYNKTLFTYSVIESECYKQIEDFDRITNEELFKDIYTLLFVSTSNASDISIRSKKIEEIKKILYS